MQCVCEPAPRVTFIPFLCVIICILLLLISVLGQQDKSTYVHTDNSTVKTQYIGISTDGK